MNQKVIRVTWPWLVGSWVAAFAAQLLANAMTSTAWIGYVAYVGVLTAALLLFAWTHSGERGADSGGE